MNKYYKFWGEYVESNNKILENKMAMDEARANIINFAKENLDNKVRDQIIESMKNSKKFKKSDIQKAENINKKFIDINKLEDEMIFRLTNEFMNYFATLSIPKEGKIATLYNIFLGG